MSQQRKTNSSHTVGIILLARGSITKQQFDEAVSEQRKTPSMSVAAVLVKQGAVSQQEVDACARAEVISGGSDESPLQQSVRALTEAMGEASEDAQKSRLQAQQLQDAVRQLTEKK